MHLPASTQTSPHAEARSHPAVIAICMIITVIEGFNLVVFGSVIPHLLDDATLGISSAAVGVIGGMVYIGAIAGALLAPVVAERIGRKRVLLTAIAIFALGAALTGLSVDGLMLGIGRFVTGFGVGGALTTAMTVARNSAAASRASIVVTITMAGIPLGGVVAALLAIPVLPAFGWRPMFFIGTGLALAILVAVTRVTIPVDTPQEVAGRGWTGRQKLTALFAGRGALVAGIIALCAVANMVAWQGLNIWVTDMMVDLGYSLSVALLFAFTLTGAAVLGSFATGVLADRHSSSIVAVGTASCTVLGLVGMILLPLSVPTTIVCIGLMGIGGHSTMNLVHSTTANIYPLPVRATALGWSNGTSFIGAFLGPTLGGWAIVNGAESVFVTFAGAAAICLVGVAGLFAADRSVTHETFQQPVGATAVSGQPLVPA